MLRLYKLLVSLRERCKLPQAAVCIVFDCAACWGIYECWVPRNASGVSQGSDKCMDGYSGLPVILLCGMLGYIRVLGASKRLRRFSRQ